MPPSPRAPFLLACCAAACIGVWPAQTAERQLSANTSIVESAPGGAERTYAVDVPSGRVLSLTIRERQGMAGIFVAASADGRTLVEADLSRRTTAAARTMLLPGGTASLTIRPPNHGEVERVFELQTGPLGPVTAAHRSRLTAEQLLGDGERLYRAKQLGYLKAAAASYAKSVEAWMVAGDTARAADALIHLAYVIYEQGEMKTALDTYRRARELSTPLDDRAGIAAALQGMALVAGDTSQYKDADEWGKTALESRRALGDLRGQAETIFVLQGLAAVQGRSDEARTLLTEAVALTKRAGDRVREADAYNFLGVVEIQLGRSKEAEAMYTAALTIDREEHEPVREAQRLSNLGALTGTIGDVPKAIAYLQQALPIRRTLSHPNGYGNTLYNLALNHAELGEYQKAVQEYREALRIFTTTKYTRGEGFTHRGLGDLYLTTGDDRRAEQHFQQAAAKWREISDRRGEVLVLNSLGAIAGRRKDLARAWTLHEQARTIAHAAGFTREEAQALGALANVARSRGDAALALDLGTQEVALAEKVGDRIAESNGQFQVGAAARLLRDTDKARAALRRSIALREAAEARALQAVALDELARTERDAGQIAAARERVVEALGVIETVRASAGSRELGMQFTAVHRRTFDLAIDLAMQAGEPDKAFELSERARARGLVDMMREARLDIRQGVDPALLARERDAQDQLDARHVRLTRLLAGPHPPAREAELRQDIERLVDAYRDVTAEIRRASPAYAALMTPEPLGAADVQSRLLDDATTLVEFWLGDERSYAWALGKTGIRAFELPPARRIQPLVTQAYRALNARNDTKQEAPERRAQRLAAADADFARFSNELGRLLLAPLRDALRTRRLYIVSDGELEYLPLAALPPNGAGAPLVATHEIVRLPSASVLAVVRAEVAGRARAPRGVAVFADPVFQAEDERVRNAVAGAAPAKDVRRDIDERDDSGVGALARLHFSREEAGAIAALAPAGGVRQALDFDASRAEAKKPDLGSYRYLHFATHGVVDSSHPELSGIVLSMVDRRGRPQDGFVRLHEIYNLKLRADLVVLSACQTALGQQVRSEGLIGLVRGFMYAGSPQVVASLWSVRDRATAEFMRRFYEELLTRRRSPEAALRAAQLAMMADPRWNQPYFWAAFTVQGGR